jgi:hypothetical protein
MMSYSRPGNHCAMAEWSPAELKTNHGFLSVDLFSPVVGRVIIFGIVAEDVNPRIVLIGMDCVVVRKTRSKYVRMLWN